MTLNGPETDGLCAAFTAASATLMHVATDDAAWEAWAKWARVSTGEDFGPSDRLHMIESARLLVSLVESLRADTLERQLLDYLAEAERDGRE